MADTDSRRGRKRTRPDAYYELRDSFRRLDAEGNPRRGRPSKATVMEDLTRLGVEFDPEKGHRELEVLLKDTRARRLAEASAV